MLIFNNPGLIDIDAAVTLGVSVKDSDSPIGYFGTGLKFAIATILRNGGKVTIYRGRDAYRFEAEPTEMRGETFDLVTMNGQRLGWTTQLGRNWQPWMAFRELASNALDEGGRYVQAKSAENLCHSHMDGCTNILVEGLDEVWPERGSIILETKPLAENDHVEVHAGTNLYVFYRGVRIYKAPRPLLLTYNIKETINLTEDRTATSYWACETPIERGIGKLEDEQLLRKILTCGELFGEHHMNVPSYGAPAEAFREAARKLTFGGEGTNLNPAAAGAARASAIDDMQPGDGMQLSELQQSKLERARSMLVGAGFDLEAFPIICCDTLGPGIHGLAKDGKIFLAAAAFEKGTRELAATLFEEFAHIKSGCSDETRAFQNWLIDQILTQTETSQGQPF